MWVVRQFVSEWASAKEGLAHIGVEYRAIPQEIQQIERVKQTKHTQKKNHNHTKRPNQPKPNQPHYKSQASIIKTDLSLSPPHSPPHHHHPSLQQSRPVAPAHTLGFHLLMATLGAQVVAVRSWQLQDSLCEAGKLKYANTGTRSVHFSAGEVPLNRF